MAKPQRSGDREAEIAESGLPIYSEEEKNRLTLEAIEDVRKRGGIPHEEVVAWAKSLSTDRPLPAPKPRKF